MSSAPGDVAFPLTVRIKSSGNSGEDKDCVIESEKTTVQEVKAKVFDTFSVNPATKMLRLIYSGKLLEPGSALIVSQFNLKANSVVHAVFSNKTPTASGSGDVEMGSLRGQGPHGYLPVATAVADGPAGEAPAPQTGLGRLESERGLSPEEVAALRNYFAADIGAVAARMARPDASESEAAFALRAEDQWMAMQGEHSEFHQNLPPPQHQTQQEYSQAQMDQLQGFLSRELLFNAFTRNNGQPGAAAADVAAQDDGHMGSYRDLLCGMSLGVLFGGIAILCLWDRNVTHRQKLGIILGVLLSFVLNFAFPPQAVAKAR